MLLTAGYTARHADLKAALEAFRSEDIPDDEALRWTWLACRTSIDLWDYDTWDILSVRLVKITRDTGALAALPLALTLRMGLHLYAGELSAVASLSAQVKAVTEATASQLAPYGALLLAGWQGREAEAFQVIEATIEEVVPRGEALGLTATQWATAVLYNGLGRYQDALAAAEQASERAEDLGFSNWSLVELVEAAVRSGERGAAADALERLTQVTRPCATDWALGIEARSRALLSEGEIAENLYREAIDRLDRASVRVGARPRTTALRGMAAPRAPAAGCRASSSALLTRCSWNRVSRPSPTAQHANCSRLARPPANAAPRPGVT